MRRGSIAGTSDPDGLLEFAYCMVLDSGTVVTGLCHSVPEVLDDGRIRLTEHWQRYGPNPASGISALVELPATVPGRTPGSPAESLMDLSTGVPDHASRT